MSPETEFVTKKEFEHEIEKVRTTQEFDRQLNDFRIDSIREMLEERFKSIDERFKSIDERFKDLNSIIDVRFEIMQAKMDKSLAEHKEVTARLEGKINAVESKLDMFIHGRYWEIAGVGLIVGLVTFFVQYFVK